MYRIFFEQLYVLSSFTLIKQIALFLSYPFTYAFIFFLICWVLFFSQRKVTYFSLFFLSGLFAWFVARILKFIFALQRPFVEFGFIPGYPESGFSFPSEHVAVLTALSFCFIFINKKIGILFLILTLFVGISRIVLGVHYPMDIFGGFFVGYFVSLVFIKIFKKI